LLGNVPENSASNPKFAPKRPKSTFENLKIVLNSLTYNWREYNARKQGL
jgi:hypothetical protein